MKEKEPEEEKFKPLEYPQKQKWSTSVRSSIHKALGPFRVLTSSSFRIEDSEE